MGIQQEIKVYSKRFVAASKCVSSNDFWWSFVLSEQIFPSHKTIFEMNKRTSPNGGREELWNSRINVQMMKKGIFGEELHSKKADLATLIGLLALGLLDTTGGLAFFTLFIIVAYRTVAHRLSAMAYLTSISLLLMSTRPGMESGILMQLFRDTALEESLLSTGWMWIFPVSRIIGWLGAGLALMMLARIIQDRRSPPEDDERLPFIWSALLLLVSLQSIMIYDEYVKVTNIFRT